MSMPRSTQVDETADSTGVAPRTRRRSDWDIVLAVAAGGIAGAEARYGLSTAFPSSSGGFPWATFTVNVSGCLLIGALMVILLELTTPHRLARPFLGVGVLGGYTTYSTFAVDVQRLVLAHRPGIALAYVGATVVGCIGAVWLSTMVTQGAGQAVVTARARRRDTGGSRR